MEETVVGIRKGILIENRSKSEREEILKRIVMLWKKR